MEMLKFIATVIGKLMFMPGRSYIASNGIKITLTRTFTDVDFSHVNDEPYTTDATDQAILELFNK